MKSVYVLIFGTMLIPTLKFTNLLTMAKPASYDSSDDRCSKEEDYDRVAQNSPSLSSQDLLNKPRAQLQMDRYGDRPLEFNMKRSLFDESNEDFAANGKNSESELRKRQVGVVYKEDKPIGILQPYQRSYRFIPVRDEPSAEIAKRSLPEINLAGDADLDESYPSIYTNFKIDSKMEKKRDFDFDDNALSNLKSTIRKLRSASPKNSDKIEDELKSILDDMGLLEDSQGASLKKRETEMDRNEREDQSPLFINRPLKTSADSNCPSGNNLLSMEQKNEVKTDFNRSPPMSLLEKRQLDKANKKRRKRQHKILANNNEEEDNSNLVEDLKDSGELRFSGNKSPLAYKAEVIRNVQDEEENSDLVDDNEAESRVQRQIQKRIDSLKNEVKRKIDALRHQSKINPNEMSEDDSSEDLAEDEEEDGQRRKRHVDSLIDREKDDVDPVKNVELVDLKPLIRKRRSLDYDQDNDDDDELTNQQFRMEEMRRERARKRRSSNQLREKLKKQQVEENEEAGELLGDEAEEQNVRKRNVYDDAYFDENEDDLVGDSRSKRRDYYDEFEEEEEEEPDPRRGVKRALRRSPSSIDYDESGRLRVRRRINDDDEVEDRPRQLGDMSDLDLFGALPKSYNGELSRFKRV